MFEETSGREITRLWRRQLRFQNVSAFSNSYDLKRVFEKLRFLNGLVSMVGLTVEIKLRFRDGLVWTVGLTVEIKLDFRDGLMWTVGKAPFS